MGRICERRLDLGYCFLADTRSEDKVEALREHLVAVITGQFEEAVVGKYDRIVDFMRVGEHHGHPRGLGSNDERAELLSELLDLGLGNLLFLILGRFVAHVDVPVQHAICVQRANRSKRPVNWVNRSMSASHPIPDIVFTFLHGDNRAHSVG